MPVASNASVVIIKDASGKSMPVTTAAPWLRCVVPPKSAIYSVTLSP
jgi:hypothetical protein